MRRRDLRVIAVGGGGPGNRNDPLHYRASVLATLCRRHGRVLADGGYRGIPEFKTPIFEGNHIRRDAAWRAHRKKRARVEHALASLKNWRILRDHRRRAARLLETFHAVAALHNIQMTDDELRDSS